MLKLSKSIAYANFSDLNKLSYVVAEAMLFCLFVSESNSKKREWPSMYKTMCTDTELFMLSATLQLE